LTSGFSYQTSASTPVTTASRLPPSTQTISMIATVLFGSLTRGGSGLSSCA
jgi:hypothetical protein